MSAPYIGITGIVTDEDVNTVRELVPLAAPFRLMAGVLVSSHTLRFQSVTSRRYPPIQRANHLLMGCAEAGAWPVVHFNTRGDLNAELDLLPFGVPAMQGLQLNIVRPDVGAMRRFLNNSQGVEFILQVNRNSLSRDTMEGVLEYVDRYQGVATHALVDFSGGTGRAIDPAFANDVLCGWRSEATLGLAGGLGPNCWSMLTRALEGVPAGIPVSVDAESGLRVPVSSPLLGEKHQDKLDLGLARAYVIEARKALSARVAAGDCEGRSRCRG